MVVKKNVTVLEHLLNGLKQCGKTELAQHRLLLIDDEADHAPSTPVALVRKQQINRCMKDMPKSVKTVNLRPSQTPRAPMLFCGESSTTLNGFLHWVHGNTVCKRAYRQKRAMMHRLAHPLSKGLHHEHETARHLFRTSRILRHLG